MLESEKPGPPVGPGLPQLVHEGEKEFEIVAASHAPKSLLLLLADVLPVAPCLLPDLLEAEPVEVPSPEDLSPVCGQRVQGHLQSFPQLLPECILQDGLQVRRRTIVLQSVTQGYFPIVPAYGLLQAPGAVQGLLPAGTQTAQCARPVADGIGEIGDKGQRPGV